jgi:hypothetical protein
MEVAELLRPEAPAVGMLLDLPVGHFAADTQQESLDPARVEGKAGPTGALRRPPGRPDDAVHAAAAEYRNAHGQEEVGEEFPLVSHPRRRIDGGCSWMEVGLLLQVAGEKMDLAPLEPVPGRDQPVCMAVTFPLDQVDRYQQLQLILVSVEDGPVGAGGRVASVDEQRPDLTAPDCCASPGSEPKRRPVTPPDQELRSAS